MFKFGVSNLRRLENVEPLSIKPITILVGRNSSGKSTYLRSFPLIRQSIQTRTSSPILWYGDFVDFGSFETAVKDGDTDNNIEFKFYDDQIDRIVPYIDPDSQEESKDWTAASKYHGFSYDVSIASATKKTRIKSLRLAFEQPQIIYDIDFDADGKMTKVAINGDSCLDFLGAHNWRIVPGSLFPDVTTRNNMPGEEAGIYRPYNPYNLTLVSPLDKFLRKHVDKGISDDVVRHIATIFTMAGPINEGLRAHLTRNVGPSSWKKFYKELITTDKNGLKREFELLISLCVLPDLLNRVTSKLRLAMSETLYIGPMRARSERYYRYQDLAVSEIDADGKNFPMFLNSLTTPQVKNLSRWIESLFGYGLEVVRGDSGGHISINLIDGAGVSANIVDVGYGVSQILPVLAQIWWSRIRRTRGWRARPLPRASVPSLLAIEQPELHLHPAHQALLADAIVGEAASREASNPMRFLIETHSETMVNRLGELVGLKRLRPQDIHIVVFEADDDNRIAKVREATFDEDGSLENWPYGFFQPRII